MPDVDMDKLEVERILNLTQGFGWEKVSEQITDEHIELTLKKRRTDTGPPLGVGPS